jgi:hypothetical protein
MLDFEQYRHLEKGKPMLQIAGIALIALAAWIVWLSITRFSLRETLVLWGILCLVVLFINPFAGALIYAGIAAGSYFYHRSVTL